MIIYKCIVTDEEMFSDAFKCKEIDNGILYEVEGKMVIRTGGIDGSLIGANPSAEEVCDATDETTKRGVDIVLNHSLSEIKYTKKDFKMYMKTYANVLKAHLDKTNPERAKKFKADAQAVVVKILSDFNNFQFYTGPSMMVEGTMGMLNFREDGITPYMLFFKDGLIVEKC